MITFFRSLTYLKIFSKFWNIIHMLINVTLNSLSFLIIIGTFILAITTMFVKSTKNTGKFNDFLIMNFAFL